MASFFGSNIYSVYHLTLTIAEDNLMLEMLMKALETLTDDERSLINELYFNEKSEREVAKTMNIPHQTVHWQKGKTIKKLKKFFDL